MNELQIDILKILNQIKGPPLSEHDIQKCLPKVKYKKLPQTSEIKKLLWQMFQESLICIINNWYYIITKEGSKTIEQFKPVEIAHETKEYYRQLTIKRIRKGAL